MVEGNIFLLSPSQSAVHHLEMKRTFSSSIEISSYEVNPLVATARRFKGVKYPIDLFLAVKSTFD